MFIFTFSCFTIRRALVERNALRFVIDKLRYELQQGGGDLFLQFLGKKNRYLSIPYLKELAESFVLKCVEMLPSKTEASRK